MDGLINLQILLQRWLTLLHVHAAVLRRDEALQTVLIRLQFLCMQINHFQGLFVVVGVEFGPVPRQLISVSFRIGLVPYRTLNGSKIVIEAISGCRSG